MSVHTPLTSNQVEQWLQAYSVGELMQLEAITAGITNTIYKVSTQQGQYVLTLFEHLSNQELSFFVKLQQQLLAQQLVCPGIIRTTAGVYTKNLLNKPAMLSEFLPGATLTLANAKQCQAVGSALAQLHNVSSTLDLVRANPFDLAWHEQLAKKVLPVLTEKEQSCLQAELAYQQQQDYSSLPTGICHMDLFMDNVLFADDTLTGLLDFYYACNNIYALDLATTMCAWSITPKGINLTKGENILVAYQSNRPLTLEERHHLKSLQRYGALHFWLTRLRDKWLVPAQATVQVKAPEEMAVLLAMLSR